MTQTAEQLRKMVEENRPRPYNLDDPAELLRLYRECRGYLHTCHHKHGTDWEGRKLAMDALDELQNRTKLLRALRSQGVLRKRKPRAPAAPDDGSGYEPVGLAGIGAKL